MFRVGVLRATLGDEDPHWDGKLHSGHSREWRTRYVFRSESDDLAASFGGVSASSDLRRTLQI